MAPQFLTNIDKLEGVQLRPLQSEEEEKLRCEEKLRKDLDLFSLVRTQLWGHPTAAPGHLQCGWSQTLQSGVWWEDAELKAASVSGRRLH